MKLLIVSVLSALCIVFAAVSVDPSKALIVLSRGRSGSTELCGIVKNMVDTRIDEELLGHTGEQMAQRKNPLETVLSFFSSSQELNPGKTVGFKWKPYYSDEKYDKVWDWVAKNRVKVVYNVRNPLDVAISSVHLKVKEGEANCHAGDEECLKTQQAIKVNLDIPNLVNNLHHLWLQHEQMMYTLATHKVNFYDITYEEVNHGTMAERLSRVQAMADFLQPGYKVTEGIFNTSVVYIGHYHQNESVNNYAEVQAALKGTRFWRYLH